MNWRFVFRLVVLLGVAAMFLAWFAWMSSNQWWTSWVGSSIVAVGCVMYLPGLYELCVWTDRTRD